MSAARKLTVPEFANQLAAAICDIGAACGDDAELLDTKCVEVRALLEELDQVPDGLPVCEPKWLTKQAVSNALRETALTAYAVAHRRMLGALIQRLPAIATSMLAER